MTFQTLEYVMNVTFLFSLMLIMQGSDRCGAYSKKGTYESIGN